MKTRSLRTVSSNWHEQVELYFETEDALDIYFTLLEMPAYHWSTDSLYQGFPMRIQEMIDNVGNWPRPRALMTVEDHRALWGWQMRYISKKYIICKTPQLMRSLVKKLSDLM